MSFILDGLATHPTVDRCAYQLAPLGIGQLLPVGGSLTPQFLFDGLNAEFGFERDVCATAANAKCREFFTPEDCNYQYQLGDEKVMINVGSVGQPRDGDPRACYLIIDDDVVTYQRIEYPVQTTIDKIYDTPELDNFLGDRLRDGR